MEFAALKMCAGNWVKKHPGFSVCGSLLVIYVVYQIVSSVFVYCQDAYVTTDIVFVSPEVSGPISKLMVEDNQVVEEGSVLFTINMKPFELARDAQEAALDLASDNLKKAQDQIALVSSEVTAKQATYDD